jgi:hypothetical protein
MHSLHRLFGKVRLQLFVLLSAGSLLTSVSAVELFGASFELFCSFRVEVGLNSVLIDARGRHLCAGRIELSVKLLSDGHRSEQGESGHENLSKFKRKFVIILNCSREQVRDE